jgi:hypothetical protein
MGARLRPAGEREERLEKIRRQVADGTLVIRQATPEERAAWGSPLAAAPPRGCRAGGVREDLFDAAVRVLRGAAVPLGVGRVDRAIRELPESPRYSSATLRDALATWAADPGSGIRHVPGRGFTAGD